MDSLLPSTVPLASSWREINSQWERCQTNGQPLIAVRDAERAFVVIYDLQPVDAALSTAGVTAIRKRVREQRPYPTGTDPISQAEGVGGEAGRISGSLHAPSEQAARRLAAQLSELVFAREHWA
jgi:hypothetical protein